MHRYLAIVHLSSRWGRAGEDPKRFVEHLRKTYPDAETILPTEQGCVICLVDPASAQEVWKELAPGLARGDNLSVVEVGRDIRANHAGLKQWNFATRWLPSIESEQA